MSPRESPRPLFALCAAALFALIQAALPNGIPPLDLFLMFANGIAVAIYAPLLRRDGPDPRRLASCINLALLGITHFAWLLPVGPGINMILTRLGVPGNTSSTASLFLATGLVFTVAITLDLRTLQSAAILLAATAISTALVFTEHFWRHWGPKNPPHMIGLPSLPLHAGIALALFLPALREQRKHRPGFCPTCGYDLRSLSTAVCPECGGDAVQGPKSP